MAHCAADGKNQYRSYHNTLSNRLPAAALFENVGIDPDFAFGLYLGNPVVE